MPKISLSMIVKNEEKSLKRCLDSVKDWVDEIVILDTGSTDKTLEIAQQYTVQIFHYQWCDNFSLARNECLKYVTGDWVLVLDADEVINPKIIPQIQQMTTQEDNLVINLIREEIGALQSPYSLVSRLFRRHSALKFSRPYHAMIDDSVLQLLKQEKHWQIKDLNDVAIFHYGYHPDVIASQDKSTKAEQAIKKFLDRNPYDAYGCSKLGALYIQNGKEKEGIKLLKQGLKSNQASSHVLFELHYHLGNAYSRQGKAELAAKHYQKAIEQPILPQLKLGAYNNSGSLLMSLGDFNSALKAYQTTLNIDPNFATGYYNLGMAFKAMGRLNEAISAYEKAIQINPNYADAYQNLGVVLLKVGNYLESSKAFEKAVQLHESQNHPEEAEKLRQGLKEIGINL